MFALADAKKCIVVGAGIAGLSAALLLAESRPTWEVEIWEGASEEGGLLAPIEFCGVECDRGSHRIHPAADPLLLELTGEEDWQHRPRRGMLVLNHQLLAYPPKPVGFLRGLGVRGSLSMGIGFLRRPGALRRFLSWERDRGAVVVEDEGFETFVKERVGGSAYERFYRPYVEKVWGMDPSAISRSVAKQRVSTSSPWQTLLGALRGGKHKAAPHFLYPRWGMASLIRVLRRRAIERGVTLHFQKTVTSAEIDDLDASSVLFSGHLSDLSPEHELGHRGLYLLHVAFPLGSVEAIDTFYTPESKFWFGRVSQIGLFSPSLQVDGKQILCIEIPEGRWGISQDFTQRKQEVVRQLVEANILRRRVEPLAIRQTFLPRVYPMYTRGWTSRWKAALEEVGAKQRLFPIGRQGLFLHCNIDHCVRIAQDAVHHILEQNNGLSWCRGADRYLDIRVRD